MKADHVIFVGKGATKHEQKNAPHVFSNVLSKMSLKQGGKNHKINVSSCFIQISILWWGLHHVKVLGRVLNNNSVFKKQQFPLVCFRGAMATCAAPNKTPKGVAKNHRDVLMTLVMLWYALLAILYYICIVTCAWIMTFSCWRKKKCVISKEKKRFFFCWIFILFFYWFIIILSFFFHHQQHTTPCVFYNIHKLNSPFFFSVPPHQ